jgi:nucleolar protein 4
MYHSSATMLRNTYNLQVVKRRVEKIGDAGNPNAGDRKRRSRPSENDSDVEAPEPSRRPKLEGQKAQFSARVKTETPAVSTGRPEKRRRTGDKKDSTPKEVEADGKDNKAGKGMGGLIGNKRKERKAKAGK